MGPGSPSFCRNGLWLGLNLRTPKPRSRAHGRSGPGALKSQKAAGDNRGQDRSRRAQNRQVEADVRVPGFACSGPWPPRGTVALSPAPGAVGLPLTVTPRDASQRTRIVSRADDQPLRGTRKGRERNQKLPRASSTGTRTPRMMCETRRVAPRNEEEQSATTGPSEGRKHSRAHDTGPGTGRSRRGGAGAAVTHAEAGRPRPAHSHRGSGTKPPGPRLEPSSLPCRLPRGRVSLAPGPWGQRGGRGSGLASGDKAE